MTPTVMANVIKLSVARRVSPADSVGASALRQRCPLDTRALSCVGKAGFFTKLRLRATVLPMLPFLNLMTLNPKMRIRDSA